MTVRVEVSTKEKLNKTTGSWQFVHCLLRESESVVAVVGDDREMGTDGWWVA